MEDEQVRASVIAFLTILAMLVMIGVVAIMLCGCSLKTLEPIAEDVIDIDKHILEAETGLTP